MAVFARCTECDTRRDHCANVSAHKRFLKWTADVKFSRTSPRVQKSFDTKEHADIQERQWRTDWERGQLLPKKLVEARTFEAVADEWFAMAKAQNVIAAAHRHEQYRVNGFKKFFKGRQISDLKFGDADRWITDRRANGIAVNTVNREMKPLNWIMNYARKKGYITANPFLEVVPLKGGNVHDRWMTQDELNALVRAARELNDHDLVDMIAIGVNTGFRLGNLERLTARDITTNRIEALVTKSGSPYSVPIAPAIVPILQRLIAAHPTGPLLNTKKIGRRFRAAAKKAGLYTTKEDLQRVTIHTLRHTFAVLYLKRGGDLYKLSKLLGHASTAITDKIYARLCPQEKDAQAPLMSTPIAEECPQAESNRSSQLEKLMS